MLTGQSTFSACEEQPEETPRERHTYWVCYWLAVGIIGTVFFLAVLRGQPIVAGLMALALRELSDGYVRMSFH